jgi:hypothetical protein
MLNLKQFIVEEKNTHMTHIEELMFLGGDASRNSKTLGIPGLRIIVSIENSRVKKALSI